MKRLFFFFLSVSLWQAGQAQTVFTIVADSVKLTNCDTTEFILENHTQGVPGFLFNTGRGRTQFRHILTNLGNNTYLVGTDTLSLVSTSQWLPNGTNIYNANTGNVGIHRTSPVAMLDMPGPINVDDTSSYQIHNIPVLQVGSPDVNGDYSSFSAGAAAGIPSANPGNTFVGDSAGYNSQGPYNTFLGTNSGAYSQADGFGNTGQNTFVGALSGQHTIGAGNSAVGYNAGNTINGSYNVSLGSNSGMNCIGDDNVYAGYNTGMHIQGSYNTLLGGTVGQSIATSAYGLTLIGGGADVQSDGLIDAAAIGYGSFVYTSYTMVFGDNNTTTWRFNSNAPNNTNAALIVGYNATNGNGAYLTKTGVWTNVCDSNKKENFETLDGKDILDRINQLPVTRWNYKGNSAKHIGPVAQDFYRLFNLGSDNKTITTVDPSGVALVGIQELYRLVEQAETQVSSQQAQLDNASSIARDQQALIDELHQKLQLRETQIAERREQINQLLQKAN